MVSFSPCKINLGLNVLQKRTDGFHDIETCFYPLPFFDVIEILPSSVFSLTTSGNIVPGDIENNLCVRAYRLLKKAADIPPATIHLHKIIPTGAGLGGGSSNAAHTLRLLNTVFELNLSVNQLTQYAQQLGSDCAFFVEDEPKIGLGTGDILKPISISLKNKFLVLLKPDVHSATAEAYSAIIPAHPSLTVCYIMENIPFHKWKDVLKNDFEIPLFKKYPVIEKLKKLLYNEGAVYAAMSGSGSAVYGIFEAPVDTQVFSHVVWAGVLSV